MESIPLEAEQEQLFCTLVEALRSVPRDEREDFVLLGLGEHDLVQGNGARQEVLGSDVQHLVHVGLMNVTTHHTKGRGYNFYLPPHALDYYGILKSRAGEAVEQIEGQMHSYLDSASFRKAHPGSYSRWQEAVTLLWSAESDRELSTIGHKCREAVQAFATELIDLHGPPGDINPDKAATRDRISAVIKHRRAQLGRGRGDLLDALFEYWRAAGDLIQRQEHAGQREREPLGWEDARRVVFQTAVVMFELHRTL